LTLADQHAHSWVDAAKAGKPYQPERFVALAREGMESFVKTQKQFLDVISEETGKATGGKRANGSTKKMKPTELSELARNSTDAFIEAQKRLVDVAGRQVNANVKSNGTAPAVPVSALERTHPGSCQELRRGSKGIDGRSNKTAQRRQEGGNGTAPSSKSSEEGEAQS
jgi:hypothetical protein